MMAGDVAQVPDTTVTVELYYILIRPSQPIICAGDMYCSCVCCQCIVSGLLEHSDTPYIFWTCLTDEGQSQF